jgi:hypothetical protein
LTYFVDDLDYTSSVGIAASTAAWGSSSNAPRLHRSPAPAAANVIIAASGRQMRDGGGVEVLVGNSGGLVMAALAATISRSIHDGSGP